MAQRGTATSTTISPTADRSHRVPPGVFEALHQIGVAIGGVLEPVGLARLVSEHARALLSAYAVGLWLFDSHKHSLHALHLENGGVQATMEDLRPGEGLVGQAFEQHEPVVVLDYEKWEHGLQHLRRDADPPAMVAVPMLVGGRAIGVLAVGFQERGQATSAAIKTLTLLAAQVAPALEAARLYEASQAELAERRHNEEVLRFQSQLLVAVEHALIAIDLNGSIRYWNRAAETMYGWRADEALGRQAREMLVPEDRCGQGDEISARLRAGESWSGEFMVRRRDGTVFPAFVSDSPVRDADGRLIGVVGASVDLSERIAARRSLAESEQRFRSLFEHHPDAVFAFDAMGKVTLANPGCEQLCGYSVQEIVNEPRTYDTPEVHEVGVAAFEAALRGEPQRFESVVVHKDGHRLDVRTTQIPIVVDGRVTGVFGIARDITETRQAREKLRASEQRFRAIWEHAAYAMVLSDSNGVIQLANPACCALYGVWGDDLIGRHFTLICGEAKQMDVGRWYRELFAEPQPPPTFTTLVHRPYGDERTVECHAEFVSQAGERVGLITTIRDITERVQAEQERETLLQSLATAHQSVQELLAQVLRPGEHEARSVRRRHLEARAASLTPRELDVLRELTLGKTNPAIGTALGLSSKAARNRVAHVLAKLGVTDRTQAAVLAVELGLANNEPL